MEKHCLSAVAATGLLLSLSCGIANAELVTVEVTATVTQVDDPSSTLGSSISVGSEVTGSYVFESTTPDQDAYSEYGHYPHSSGVGGFDVNIGGQNFKTDPNGNGSYPFFAVHVVNSSYNDGYHVISADNLMPLSSGAQPRHISIDLYTFNNSNILSSDTLPLTPPAPNQFDEHNLYVYGNSVDGSSYFHITTQISSLIVSSPAGPPGTYNISAQVNDVYDPNGILGGAINFGDLITGNYNVDLTLGDQEPSPNYGRYVHLPQTNFGFNLSGGGLQFVTDNTARPLEVMIANDPSYDHYDANSAGAPTGNGLVIEDIFFSLYDPTGNGLSSTDLDQQPNLSQFQHKDLYISGHDGSGNNYFSFIATLTVLEAAAEPEPTIALTPGASTFVPAQRFDLGVLVQPGYDAMSVTGTVNGNQSYYFGGCHTVGGNGIEGMMFLCPDAQYLLDMPGGTAHIEVRVQMNDGTEEVGSAVWKLRSP